jgi:branched-chain amino acid transport system permease protein
MGKITNTLVRSPQYASDNRSLLLLLAAFGTLCLLPFVSTAYIGSLIILANVYAIFAVAWDFLSGLTGYLNFGPSFFVGASAYGMAIPLTQFDVPFLLALLLGLVIAVLAGLILSFPALRLRGFYFVLITVLLPLLSLKFVTIFSDITGGNLGIRGIPRLSLFEAYYGSLLLLVAVFAIVYWLARSDFGLVLRGIKANELAVESAGISTTRFKAGAFAVSSFITAVGGLFYASYIGTVLPSTTLNLHVSIEIILSAMIGGIGTIYGPIGGAYIFITAREILAPLGSLRFVVLYGLSGVILYFLPDGIVPTLWNKATQIMGDNNE